MTETDAVKTHPIQCHYRHGMSCKARIEVTLRAYEVYCKVFGPQPALVTDGCRGGFGIGELIAFLYAHSFPENEWSARFREALKGLEVP